MRFLTLHIALPVIFIFFCGIMMAQTKPIRLIPLPKEINTLDDEELGRWTLDGKAILFSRLTKEKVGIWKAYVDSIGGIIKVENMPVDPEYRGGGYSISPDGKTLLLTLCDTRVGLGNCDLFQSHLVKESWSEGENLGRGYNGQGWDAQPAYGLDGTSIYYASTRPGGYGGSDIWFVRQISPGIVSNPINAGPGINTADNEGSPFVHFDGRTIYFMRDGKNGFGGYDLYFAHLGIDNQWMQSENMGPSINTTANEGGLAIHPDGKKAMITRSTPDRQNDLFQFDLPDQFQSTPVQALNVHVTDEITNAPVRAQLEVFDIIGDDTVRVSQIADGKGNITVTIDRNKNIGLIATANGYIMHSENLASSDEAARKLEVKMTPIASAVKKTIALQNIFFETGSSALSGSSTHELKTLLGTLKTNKGMQIELRGHTDNTGSALSNQKLSEARAKSVYQYLIDNGIAAERLSYKGFGETQPIGDNATEAGRKQNRRTEFVILKI